MSRIAQKIGLAGALIGALFTADMAKPTDAEARGGRGYGGSSFSSIVCIGGCFPGFYTPFIPVRYVQPAVVSVPYYVPTAAYPATGAYFINGQPSTASASATATAQAQDIERIRREARDEGKEVGKLQAAVDYQGQRIKDLEDRLARAPAQAPPLAAPTQTPSPASVTPPTYTIPRENRAGEIQKQDWVYAEAAGDLLIRVLGPGTMHGQRFGTQDRSLTSCYYDAIRREPKSKATPKDPSTFKYWAVVVGKETGECKSKREAVIGRNKALDISVFEFNPADINVADYQTARKRTEEWADRNGIPRTAEDKAPLLVR